MCSTSFDIQAKRLLVVLLLFVKPEFVRFGRLIIENTQHFLCNFVWIFYVLKREMMHHIYCFRFFFESYKLMKLMKFCLGQHVNDSVEY